MKRSDRILGALLLLGAAVTIAYWVNYVFNIERGLYRLLPASGAMAIEALLNVASLALGITTVTMCWRRALALTGSADAQRS